MRKYAFVAVVVLTATMVFGQGVDRAKMTKSGLWLQNAMLHNGDDGDVTHDGVAANPWVYLWSKGTGGTVTIRYYTSYISDRPGEHHQRIVILNPRGTVVAEVSRGFRTEIIQNGSPQIYMARMDEVVDIPPQDTADMGRFGAWDIKIFADDALMAEYPIPYVAYPNDD